MCQFPLILQLLVAVSSLKPNMRQNETINSQLTCHLVLKTYVQSSIVSSFSTKYYLKLKFCNNFVLM